MKYRERIYSSYVSSIQNIQKNDNLGLLDKRKPALKNLIKNLFPKDKQSQILEIGCGYGALIFFAKEMGYENIEGVDGSVEQIQLAKALNIDGVTESDLLGKLNSLNKDALDVVVAFDVIEHFTKVELIELVDAVYRVLKPNGRWIIHAPNGRSPFAGAITYGDYTHEQAFTEASLTQLLKSSGFREVCFSECGPLINSVKSFIRVIIWRITRLILTVVNAAETGSFERNAIWTRNLYAIAYK